MIDPLSAIYLAIGILIGFSAAVVIMAREPKPQVIEPRERIAPDAKVAPMHVFQSIGTPVESVSRIFEKCASGEITSDEAADLLMRGRK